MNKIHFISENNLTQEDDDAFMPHFGANKKSSLSSSLTYSNRITTKQNNSNLSSVQDLNAKLY